MAPASPVLLQTPVRFDPYPAVPARSPLAATFGIPRSPRDTNKTSPPRSASPGASLPSPKRARKRCSVPAGGHVRLDGDRYPARRALDTFAMPRAIHDPVGSPLGGVPMPQCRIQIDTSSKTMHAVRPSWDRSDSAISPSVCRSTGSTAAYRTPSGHHARDSLSPFDDRLLGRCSAASTSGPASSAASPASAISTDSFLCHRRSSSALSVGSSKNRKRLSISLPGRQESAASQGSPRDDTGEPANHGVGSLSLGRASGTHRRGLSMFSVDTTDAHGSGPSRLGHSSPSQSIALPISREITAATEGDESFPYALGPKEVLPGVWIGSERSVAMWDTWCPARATIERRGQVINVAQELRDPFLPVNEAASYPAQYEADAGGRPTIDYVRAPWSHGQAGLADPAASESDAWGFRRAIEWLERGRVAGVPVLIHCQCGISRSATLLIAYVMYLANGLAADTGLAHLAGRPTMEVYDWVKTRSRWIGPNVALMSQLLAWERVLSREHGSGVTDRIEEASMGPEPDRLWREAQGEAARVEAAALDLRMIQNQA